MKMTKEEEMTMKLTWEALFQCQDEDSIRLGGKYKDNFVVWRHGEPYKVTVEHASEFGAPVYIPVSKEEE